MAKLAWKRMWRWMVRRNQTCKGVFERHTSLLALLPLYSPVTCVALPSPQVRPKATDPILTALYLY